MSLNRALRRCLTAVFALSFRAITIVGCIFTKRDSFVFFHRCIGIGTPLFPAKHEDFDFGITGQFQGESLDRGSTTGLSVTDCRFIR